MEYDIVTHIAQGNLIVFPTDTVYGIACDPFNEHAIAKLYEAKKRPPEKSIPVLVSSIKKAHNLGIISAECDALLQRYWPGALTVIVKQKVLFPKNISSDNTIALRMPNHAYALQIIKDAGGALAVTSANTSGHTPATDAHTAQCYFQDTVYVIDGGVAPGGQPSTIINCTTEPFRVVREGPVILF